MLGRGQRLPFDVPDDGLGVGRHTLTLLAAIALSVLIHFGILLLCAPIRFGGGLPQLQEAQSAMERIPPLQVSLVPKTAAPPPLEPAAPDPAAAAGQSAQEVADILKGEIQTRAEMAGIEILEARISHLAYAPEIAAAMLQRQQASAIIAARQKIVEGAIAPDFTLNDLNGKPLALSSLRGKYVVLDFWGSWCGWCIKGIPDMKKYYEKYKGKMEILGIDCRDTEEKWKAAVAKYELPWLHVRNEGEPDVSLLYAVQGYPTKIVIDPEGKIAKIAVGESPAFYEYLDELFN